MYWLVTALGAAIVVALVVDYVRWQLHEPYPFDEKDWIE